MTVAAAAGILAGQHYVPLPGFPLDGYEPGRYGPGPGVSPAISMGAFALGVVPAISAYMVVEVIAFLAPGLSRLRHGGSLERAPLERAARILMLALAALQAYGISISLKSVTESDRPETVSTPLVMLTLIAGATVCFLVARFVTRHGLVNGFVLLLGLESVRAGVAQIGLFGSSWRDSVVPLMATVAVVVATLAALRGAGDLPGTAALDARGSDGSAEGMSNGPYRAARSLVITPSIPVPASSLAAFTFATSILLILAALESANVAALGGVARALSRTTGWTAALLVTTWILALGLAHLLHRPREMADLVSRVGGSSKDTLSRAASALRRTLPSTLLYLTVLVVASAAVSSVRASVAIAAVPLVVALVLDLARGVRVHTGRVPWVAVWDERRAAAVPVLRAVLGSEGIASEARGAAFLALAQVFAPYAPAEIYVKEEHAARATAVLAHLLQGADKPVRDEAHHDVGDGVTRSSWPMWQRTTALGAALLVSAAALVVGVVRPSAMHAGESGVVAGVATPVARLELSRVDDSVEPFAARDDESLPAGEGLSFGRELVPLRPGAAAMRRFPRLTLRDGETIEAGRARLVAWLATFRLDGDARFALQDLADDDGTGTPSKVVGVRAFVLTGAPIVRTEDIVDAAAVDVDPAEGGAYVALTLSREAAKRFEAATREWVERRIVIVVDDRVLSAPVVKSAIGGGRLSITVGGDPESALATAEALARSLEPR